MKHLSLNNSSDRYLAVSGVESHPAKLTWCQTCYLLSRQWLHLNTKCIQFPVWTLATDFVAYFHVSQIGSDELRPFTLMRIGVTSVVDPADNRTQCEEPRRDDCWKWIAAERLRWILISAYSGSVFKGGVPQGNLDGKAGLLILKKVLICSLLALRTLITSIVVLVPLRPEWMSLLRNSFLLPCRWRRSHQKRPEWDVRLPADFIQHEALSSFTALLTFSVCFAVLFAWCFM